MSLGSTTGIAKGIGSLIDQSPAYHGLGRTFGLKVKGFTPASIEGLEAWFSASDQSNFSSKSTLNGWASCEQWDDLSGEGNHATQTGGTAPFIEGNVLYFSSDQLAISDIGIGTSDFSFGAVFQARTTSSVGPVFSSRATSGSNQGFLLRTNTDKTITALLDFGGTSVFLNSTASFEYGKFYFAIVSVDRDGSASLYWYDEDGTEMESAITASVSSHSAVDLDTSESWYIGSDRAAQFSQMFIREAYFWRSALTSDQVESMASYVNDVYPALLPSDSSLSAHQFAWYNSDSFAESSGEIDEATDLFGNYNLTNLITSRRPNVGTGLNSFKSFDLSTHPNSGLFKTGMTTPTMLNHIILAKFDAVAFSTANVVAGLGDAYDTTNSNSHILSYTAGTNRVAMTHRDGVRAFLTSDRTTTEQWRIIIFRAARRGNGTTNFIFDYAQSDSESIISQVSYTGSGDGSLDALNTSGTGTQNGNDNFGIGSMSGIPSFRGEILEYAVFDESTNDGSFGVGQLLDIMRGWQSKYGI